MVKNTEIEFKVRSCFIKKVKFTTNQIILIKRKEEIVIPLLKIEKILYAKRSFINNLSLGFGDWRTTGVLYIYLKEKINKKKMYCFFLKYENLEKIPNKLFKMVKFYDSSESW